VEPIDYLRALRRRWLVVAGCLGVAILAAALTMPAKAAQGPVSTSYTATYTMILAPDAAGTNLSRVKLLITTGEIPKAVDREVNFPGNAAELATLITVATDSDLGTVKIAMSDPDGRRATRYANAFGEQTLVSLRKEAVQNQKDQLAALQPLLNASEKAVRGLQLKVTASPTDKILQAQLDAEASRYQGYFQQYETIRAQTPNGGFTTLDKASPVPITTGGGFAAPTSRSGRLLLAAVLGLILGLVGALSLDRLDTRLRGRQSFEEAFRLPVLAEIPQVPRRFRRNHQLLVRSQPSSAPAEAYRSLRSGLMLLPSLMLPRSTSPAPQEAAAGGIQPEVILVTSGAPREGKTTTLVNLATCLAEVGKRVLVLDCDFRASDAHLYLDVPFGTGVSDLLVSGRSEQLGAVARRTTVPGVDLVTSGTVADHPAAYLAGMGELIDAARRLADVILIDSAPVLGANDAVDLMPYVDSLLVVARNGRTSQAQAERVSSLIARIQVPALGVALVGTPRRKMRTSGGVLDLPNLFRRQPVPRPEGGVPSEAGLGSEPDRD
jgi:Mrp family chromosome partitioning ATPase